jgi:ATP-dependent DNA ligase
VAGRRWVGPAGACLTARWPSSESAKLIDACGNLGVEGDVLKRADSPYLPVRRSPDWRRLNYDWVAREAAGPTERQLAEAELVALMRDLFEGG